MSKDLFSLREREIFNTLKEIKVYNLVVIGGYAVNAYTLPRFSVDCDIVVKDKSVLKKIGLILQKNGYKKVDHPGGRQYARNFFRYKKVIEKNFAVSMDILIDSVIDRGTGAVFETEWIFKNSKMRILRGKTINEELRLKIINVDALLVMKMISCRLTDIRDVFMMIINAENKEWIKSEIESRCDIKDRITKIIEKISSKQFKDGLSGVYGYFDTSVFERHKKAVIGFNP